jgi:peptide/nickel transport system ATP-binding protein
MSSTRNGNEMTKSNLLEIQNLRVEFDTPRGTVYALRGVDLPLVDGKITGVAGETGCGKSVTALSIMRLVLKPGRIAGGAIRMSGEDLLAKSEAEMMAIRGPRIAMVFQNPRASLNPLFTVGQQLGFILHQHQGMTRGDSLARGIELLEKVGIADPKRRIKAFPHELSTGMCQRVMIAMALSCNPRLLLADEPTTGLDVTIEAQILDLFRDLIHDFGSTAMLITHDLGVISETCEYVAVMFAGRVVEYGPTTGVFDAPEHPYTQGLLGSFLAVSDKRQEGFHFIRGSVPSLLSPIVGCSFAPRCDKALDICLTVAPRAVAIGTDRVVECHLHA